MIFGHKQEILVIVLVKFRDVTELFILIKNFRCIKESIEYSSYLVNLFTTQRWDLAAFCPIFLKKH